MNLFAQHITLFSLSWEGRKVEGLHPPFGITPPSARLDLHGRMRTGALRREGRCASHAVSVQQATACSTFPRISLPPSCICCFSPVPGETERAEGGAVLAMLCMHTHGVRPPTPPVHAFARSNDANEIMGISKWLGWWLGGRREGCEPQSSARLSCHPAPALPVHRIHTGRAHAVGSCGRRSRAGLVRVLPRNALACASCWCRVVCMRDHEPSIQW